MGSRGVSRHVMRDNTENFEEDHYVTLDRALFSFLPRFLLSQISRISANFTKLDIRSKSIGLWSQIDAPLGRGVYSRGLLKEVGVLINFRPFIKGGVYSRG